MVPNFMWNLSGIEILSQHWVEICNYQRKRLHLKLFQTKKIRYNKSKAKYHSYINYNNEQDACDSRSNMIHLFKKFI